MYNLYANPKMLCYLFKGLERGFGYLIVGSGVLEPISRRYQVTAVFEGN